MHSDRGSGIMQDGGQREGIHVLVKPVGPICNLNCTYCFYLDKKALFSENENYYMPDRVLETFVKKYISTNNTPVIPFVWQGGEPMLAGIEFFRRIVTLQKQYRCGKRITNAIQTNGTLMNDKWCEFLAENDFLVGISIDGPEDIHNRYRMNGRGIGSFSAVMKGVNLLEKHGVEYNVLACVTRESARRPLDVYHFFKEEGMKFIQFIPIVERMPDENIRTLGLTLAGPPDTGEENGEVITPWTVESEDYGDFLISVFNEWVKCDVGQTFVMNYEWALMAWMGGAATICQFARQCGRSVILEHDGSLYACDHFVYPKYLLGNILDTDLHRVVESSEQKAFGSCKETALSQTCRDCDVLFACRGGCPKHRFATTLTNEPRLNYLCAGYKKFFRHINKYMKAMRQLLENNLPVSYIMEATRGPLVIKLRP